MSDYQKQLLGIEVLKTDQFIKCTPETFTYSDWYTRFGYTYATIQVTKLQKPGGTRPAL